MHLGAADGVAACLPRPDEILDWAPYFGAANLAEALRQLACRPARYVLLGGARVVNDLPLRQVTSRKERRGLTHRGGQREVS